MTGKKIGIIALMLAMAISFEGIAAGRDAVALKRVARELESAGRGDTIFIADGVYSDVTLKWVAPGFPVVVMPLNPGGVTVTGESSLRFCGDSLTVAGLDFVKAHPKKGSVVEFRCGSDVARNCRLTDCRLDSCNPETRDVVSSYIVLHGRNNRVDHCSLTGKLGIGVTLLVNLNDARSLENYHRVDNNYFGPRPVYGSNGAETMRIGTSQQSYETSGTVVENNFFERCNGEVEIISVKSCDNVVRGNVFFECEGVVALRHGKRNRVESNVFAGNGVRNTGGVRVVDSGHIVSGNAFYNLRGTRFFSALALMNSVPNSLPNRYVQVSDVVVSDNLFVDCSNIEFGTGKDMERTQAPVACRFVNNMIFTDSTSPFTMIDDRAEVDFSDNEIKAIGGKEYDELTRKIMEVCGALRSLCGSSRGLPAAAVAPAVKTITLDRGVVYVKEPFVISGPTHIVGDGTVLRWHGSAGDNFITIVDGGSLTVEGVTFDGALQQGYATARNGIATSPKMLAPYSLTVKNCAFINMPESGCCGIRGSKNTFAYSISIENCSFADNSGNGISLADETDDKGRYSADDIVISGCDFSHMLGIPVNIYRGGSDESTAGPYVTVADCTFTDCCNRERGSVLRLIGPQKLLVSGCRFVDSGRGGYAIRLDETTWEDVAVRDCEWINSGKILSNRNVLK